jgi:hypothetical protein
MPNTVENYTTISGPIEILQVIRQQGLDFQTIHPSPHKGPEETFTWRHQVWGTGEPARRMYTSWVWKDDAYTIVAQYQTRFSTPHGIFAFMTRHSPQITVTTQWKEEDVETIGFASYEKGVIHSKAFDPSEFKPSALKRFSADNSWFSYKDYDIHVLETEAEGDAQEWRRDEVVVKEWTMPYEKWLGIQMP